VNVVVLRTEVIERLRADRAARDRFGVRSIALFGSVARGDAGADSDVDILVDYQPDARPDLFEFIDLKDHLEGLVGRRVDLVTPAALHPRLRNRILTEAVYA
jgi:predicted nucleotidyltransferase